MADPEAPPFVQDTQGSLGSLLTRPTLKTKLLLKPPFRFLHDIVTSFMKASNVLDGVFEETELDSGNVKTKEEKIAFLEKLIGGVERATNGKVDVRPLKIVAGLEPENTNMLLQALARAASGSAGEAAPENDGGNAEEEAAAKAEKQRSEEEARQREERKRAAARKQAEEEAQRQADEDLARAQARPAPSQKSGAEGGSLPITRNVIELPEPDGGEFYDITMQLFAPFLTRPKLNPKLLGKPPFRFIHDVVTNTLNSTGFPACYDEIELDSKNIKETKQKLSFLKKLIGIVAAARSDPSLLTTVNPKKIAAGLEPENTNLLLQQLAYAAASGVDSAACVAKMNSEESSEPAPQKPVPAEAAPDARARGPVKALEMPKLPLSEINNKDEDKEKNIYAVQSTEGEDGAPAKLSRPKTARKAPPKLKSNLVTEAKTEDTDSADTVAGGVIMDGEDVKSEEDSEPEELEPLKGFQDPEIKTDAPAGHLVQNILNAQNEASGEKEEKKKGTFERLRSARKTQNNALYNMKNVQDLRKQIQNICQSANPLGKCVDFVYDDMDSMNKELAKWRKAYQTYLEKFDEEKENTTEILEPLTTELSELNEQLAEQAEKTQRLEATIMRNDRTIMDLMEAYTTVKQ